jgi:hypothetical protein
MRPWYRAFLYIGTFPSDVLMWLAIVIVRALWGRSMRWSHGVVVVHLAHDSWPLNQTKKFGGWYAKWGGTAIGHAVMINGAMSGDQIATVMSHELIHVEQFESHGLATIALVLAFAPFTWPLALVVWLVFPWVLYGAGMLTALLRGEDPYRGSHLEEAAYRGQDHGAG